MENRKHLKALDSAAVKEARQALSDVHDCCESDVLLMNVVNECDRLKAAIYSIRNINERVMENGQVHCLRETLVIANDILGDRL